MSTVTSSPPATNAPRTQNSFGAKFALAFALFGVWIVWGGMYLITHKVLTESPPLWMAAVRFTIAGSGLFTVLALRRAPMPTARQWRNAVLTGVIMMGMASGSTITAQTLNSSGIASVVASTATLWFALIAVAIGMRPSVLEWLAVLLGVAGVVVLFADQASGINPWGLALGTFAALTWAVGSVLSQRLDLPSGWMRTATQMLSGGVFLVILSTLRGETPLLTPSPGVALAWAAAATASVKAPVPTSWRARPTWPVTASASDAESSPQADSMLVRMPSSSRSLGVQS